MAFMDKLSNMAKNAADKTSDMVEISKLNSKINESKIKITARKSEIGEYYWAKYESGETLDAETTELCAAIKAENEAIEEYNREIQKIKAEPAPAQATEAAGEPGLIACASCGAAIPAGKKFCPECGAAMPAPEPELPAAEESARCSSCGEELPAGKKFCPECGAPQ